MAQFAIAAERGMVSRRGGPAYDAVRPMPGWLEATASVPRPKNHELHHCPAPRRGEWEAKASQQVGEVAGFVALDCVSGLRDPIAVSPVDA